MELSELILDIEQQIEIKAPISDVFDRLIHRLSDENATPDGTPLQMKLETRPGGRWFRDLGEGVGHLWGFVQVIKPPTLLEIQGPMFMSYPACGHLALRLTETDSGAKVSLRHRVLGMIEEDHRKGVVPGWQSLLDNLKRSCE